MAVELPVSVGGHASSARDFRVQPVACPAPVRRGAGSPQWAALAAIADEDAGYPLGFINRALYHIGQAPPHYAASFYDITSGNNSFPGLGGFDAGTGWDATTGLGSPKSADLVGYLIQFVSPGDGAAAIAASKPHAHGNAHANGQMKPQ
jgi:hypothetical protein